MQRRRFILGTIAAAPLLGAKNRIGMDRVAVLTDEVAASPADAIAFAKKHGVRWVELRGLPGGKSHYGSMPEDRLKQAAQEFKDNGLQVSFLNTGFFKITLPGTQPVLRRNETAEDRERRAARDRAQFDERKVQFENAFRSAHIFGVDQIRVFTFLRVADPPSVFQQVADVIGEMALAAGREKIRLLVENEGACNVITCAETAAFMKMLPEKTVGINWDPMNGADHDEPPYPQGYGLLPKKRVFNVQMKGRSLLDPAKRLPWGEILSALEKDGYKGKIGLETHWAEGGLLIERSHKCMDEIRRIVERS